MDLISVIVPVYKVEAYLDHCVQSIIDQTYKNLEIILVDDGSPDRCPQKCDEWAKKDSRVRVIHKKNGGLSDARNAGLEIAQGSYICFVDSDDWVDTHYIEYLYQGIRQSGAEISACDIRIVYDHDADTPTDIAPFQFVINTPESAIGTLIKGHTYRAVAWNKLYSAKLLESESFAVGKYNEDEFFTYRILAKANSTAYINIPLYNYLQRSGSIMSTFNIRRLDALEAYANRLSLFKEKYPQLYIEDSATFSIACANFCIAAMDPSTPDSNKIIRAIRIRRKQVRYPFALLKKQSLRNLAYIFGTRIALRPFCWVLRKTRKD